MLLRRGHRLHSVGGTAIDPSNLHRFEHIRNEVGMEHIETELWNAVQEKDIIKIQSFKGGRAHQLIKDWPFVETCVKEAIETGDWELVKALLLTFCHENSEASQVGEFAIVVSTSLKNISMMTNILEFWIENNSFQIFSPLDVVAIAIQASGPIKSRKHSALEIKTITHLIETAIYVATVDKNHEVLKHALHWYRDNKPKVGHLNQMNADCILHASLENDKDQVHLLYSAGFRLGPDTTRRVNKDHLKKIKLFRARASAVYLTTAFEDSQDVENDDPMKKCLEYALQARRYANKIQDFNSEFNAVADKCEQYAIELLTKCTTKHEIQTLLQTKSYKGHHNANFNIAILDGHKELVAHEKFQQLLHKKWGQRDRVHYADDIRFNIFWSEMGKTQKLCHFLKQIGFYLLLPLIFLITTFLPCLEKNKLFRNILMQSHVPVNRFLYFELSKVLFNLIIFCTLIDGQDIAWYDVIAFIWIISYILEDFRTVHRLFKQGGIKNGGKTLQRWLTFRNMYIIITNIIFLVALILRFRAHMDNQCRRGCAYYENQMAFIGSCLWAVAALMTFLRSIQIGLMWRQTGPIIISMTYMIIDVLVFLFIFVIVYISFTLCTVYIYNVYGSNQTTHFNTHKSAFKLFYWTMIRTGNPHFPNIRDFNASLQSYNSSCVANIIQISGERLLASSVALCGIGRSGEVGEFDSDLEEGVPYITGNILWAVYQFIVFIVLLSVLRARMVNTYHRIFREADVQWKFFRACIWWKYLDNNSTLPPPFTIIFLMHAGARKLHSLYQHQGEPRSVHEEDLSACKREFIKKYKRLILTLIQTSNSSWGFEKRSRLVLSNMHDGGAD